MRRRVLTAILLVTAITIVLFGVPLALVVDRFVEDDATLRLERQAILAARDVPSDYLTTADPVQLPVGTHHTRLALYGPDGRLAAGEGPALADTTTLRALQNEASDTETSGSHIAAVPVNADERVIGAIRAEQSTSIADRRSWRIIGLFLLLALTVMGVSAAISSFLAGRLTRPIRRLSDAAVQLGDGDFTVAIPPSGIAEVDDAGRALSSTAQRLDELIERERSFSADASHQLRTPLAGLRAAIETELEFPRPDRTAVLHEAVTDIERLEQTITDLLTFARSTTSHAGTTSLSSVLNDVRLAWHGRFASADRRLTVADATDSPLVRGNASMLRNALDVLLDNALSHGAGEVRIEHHVADDNVTLAVTDEGPGFPADVPVPLAPTRERGTHGLGLTLARRLVEAMPGRLVIVRAAARPRIEIVLSRA